MPEYDYDSEPEFEGLISPRWSPPDWASFVSLRIVHNQRNLFIQGAWLSSLLRTRSVIALPSGARYRFQAQVPIRYDGISLDIFEAFPPETEEQTTARIAQWGPIELPDAPNPYTQLSILQNAIRNLNLTEDQQFIINEVIQFPDRFRLSEPSTHGPLRMLAATVLGGLKEPAAIQEPVTRNRWDALLEDDEPV